jgi:CRISPR-associated protein Csb2
MYLVIKFRWFHDCHGTVDSGRHTVEWPPSPWRLACALVSACNPRSPEEIPDSLRWLTSLPPPDIFTPPVGPPFSDPKHSVPLDDIDRKEPFRDGEKSRSFLTKFRQDRGVPVLGDKEIAYAWKLDEQPKPVLVEELDSFMAKVPYLGCSADSGAGAALLADSLPPLQSGEEHWKPNQVGGCDLPFVDTATLKDLIRFFFTGSPQSRRFRSVSPPRTNYAASGSPASVARTFRLESAAGKLASFDPREVCLLAEAIRGRILEATKKLGTASEFLHGHHSPGREHLHILPLPSIGHEHADGRLRRVLLFGRPEAGEWNDLEIALREMEYAKVERGGASFVMVPEIEQPGVGQIFGSSARHWCSVTPVILPNFELRGRDGALWKSRNTLPPEKLFQLREKITKARLSMVRKMVERHLGNACEVQLADDPPAKNIPSAADFRIPEAREKYLRSSRCHVVISTPEPIRGPLLLGKGRFFGLGLFAPVRALKFQSP